MNAPLQPYWDVIDSESGEYFGRSLPRDEAAKELGKWAKVVPEKSSGAPIP